VVIETVKQHLEGDVAGLKVGDVLSHWMCGDASGQIASPFDLREVEIEQGTRGHVVLGGWRGTEKRTWTLGLESWGIEAKPNAAEASPSNRRVKAKRAPSSQAMETVQPWGSDSSERDQTDRAWVPSWILVHDANRLAEAKRWKEADSEYRAATQVGPKENHAVMAQLFLAWGDAFRERNQWIYAAKYYERAAAESRKLTGQTLILATVVDNIGRMALERGDLDKAGEYFGQALAIRERQAPGSLAVAQSLNDLGLVAWNRGDLPQAEHYHQEALAIREKLAPGSLGVAASFNNLGLVSWNRGDLDRAEEFFHKDMNITEKQEPESLDIATTYMNLGLVAWNRGDLAKAQEYGQQAIVLFQKLAPDSLNHATELSNLGLVAQDRGDLTKAEEYFRRSLAIKNKLAPGSLTVAQTLSCLGALAEVRGGDVGTAKRYYQKALIIQERIAPDSLDLANTLNGLGAIAGQSGHLEKSERYFLRVRAITKNFAPKGLDAATNFNNLGEVERRRGNLTRAEKYFQRSLEIAEKQAPGGLNDALALGNLGVVSQERADFLRAEQFYRKALAIREKLAPESGDHAETLAALASVLRQEGQSQTAEQLYAKSLDAMESQSARLGGAEEVRLGFRARHTDIYKDYIDLLMAEKRQEAALEVAERSRAQTLLEMLAEGHTDLRKGVDADLAMRESLVRASLTAKSDRRLRLLSDAHTEAQLAAIDKEIDELVAQHQDIEAQIRASSPAYAALTQPQPLTAPQIQEQLLDEDTVLLEYSLGDERSYVWAVTSSSLNAFELPKRSEIERAARGVYRLLTAKNQTIEDEPEAQRQLRWKKVEADFSREAAKLSRMVLSPVAAQLARKRLLIVCDGALQNVPFGVLPVPESSQNVPLIVEHEIVNLPSASVLEALRKEESGRRRPPMEVAILADPVFDADDARVARAGRKDPGSGKTPGKEEDQSVSYSADLKRSVADVKGEIHLGRLRFTRLEAEAILSTTPASEAMSALDFQANRAMAVGPELARYRIVHFATHGLLDDRHPELSGLVLSLVDEQGRPRNGFLTLQDVYSLQLPADLVVLSACETALGKNFNGEGLIGLTRGFMYAGATRVVSSLWNVSDAATAQLMGEFYKAMEKDGLTPAAALRVAQNKMRKQKRWASPYYWGAFELQGEWK
jgi:CHAT domain-containing protein/Tfp pilus assembly protein PilF